MDKVNRVLFYYPMELTDNPKLTEIFKQIAQGKPSHSILLIVCDGQRQWNNTRLRLFYFRCERAITQASDKGGEAILVQ